MIEVRLDHLAPVILEYLQDPRMMSAILDDLSEGARAKWISEARRRLGASRQDYIAGIQPVAGDQDMRVIALVGWLPNAIESGVDPFDLRETLLTGTSALARRARDGHLYGHVPFRHGTPGSAGSVGAPMGRAYGPHGEESRAIGGETGMMGGDQVRELGESIYRAARRLRPSAAGEAGTQWGGRLPAGMAPRLAPHHTTDIYAGMAKVQHKYAKRTQTTYMTFRTISQAKPTGWRHPGIEARNLSDAVKGWIEDNAAAVVGAAIRNAMGGAR
jgi:hypothetical protein